MRASSILGIACVVGVLAVGCGDDDGDGSSGIQLGNCPDFSGCGGDIDGTWRYRGACIDDEMPFDTSACPSIEVVSTGGDVSGTLTVTDGLLTISSNASFFATLDVPGECTMGLSCETLEGALSGSDGLDSVACSTAGSGCRCTVTTSNAAMASDSITIDGNIATTGGGERYEYCVTGSTLRYRNLDDADFAGVLSLSR